MNKLIAEKLFRIRENEKKIQYILKHTDLTEELITKAAVMSRKNSYHNFGHELGSTEYAIKLAYTADLPKQIVNSIALSMLFHDAQHRGIVQRYDEMRACIAAEQAITIEDAQITGQNRDDLLRMMRNLIMSTVFPDERGKSRDPLKLIVQDADLAHLGQGPIHWLWSSMGLIKEFSTSRNYELSPQAFIQEEQQPFVEFLKSLSPNKDRVYLSGAAQLIFRNPIEDVKIVKAYTKEQIDFAYRVRYDDITLEEFAEGLNAKVLA